MIDKKYEFIAFAFFMGLFMSCFMSFVITLINLGMVDGFFFIWMGAFYKAFLVAFPTILVVVPRVRKLVAKVVKNS